jgi:hypothetical protein
MIFGWFCIFYVAIGLLLMMEGLVEAFYLKGYSKTVKVIGSTILVLCWPLIFFAQ